MPALVLASSSPRRRALLEQIGLVPARTLSPDIDETPRRGELPRDYAVRLAAEKAAAVQREPGEVVIAGDTTVAAGRRILPPADTDEIVRQCLTLLSGRRHRVYSAVAVIDAEGRLRERVAETIVTFKRLSDAEIDAYVRAGEGRGKAGGYAVQGSAAAFVRFLSGSYSGVVGLPLYETSALLAASGIAPSDG
ncbi:Maf family protein [Sphingosinicella microcystinivorans]|uniref:dTTP/UTP pyrophosphatase n=1 Tax=Sphingosinicella microcystinivorans TaxID=335406 RepID=A0AAD1D4J4_SPHMI|nr:nucleoside triphosphate pyrophosphatase [Sphingosinicella microcystinivorans]RKS85453.1 septum formation protein [Sphingosinicella microcystinivorans]BBE33257.1 Maf-like protein [Sphingosinicella microcystinivorans]